MGSSPNATGIGGNGGNIFGANVTNNASDNTIRLFESVIAGGNGGNAITVNGQDGLYYEGHGTLIGLGGGGGAARGRNLGNGGNGGNGGLYGGGGGGGGAADSTTPPQRFSGTGGNGGNGIVIVISEGN